ncbi:MAG: sigma-70 family RNA polymerase sigma factor [Acidobacteria bacterium]|jgi:RNA polymerase sigma-70 factor (ECF subfamily)|nr:sigma-70 family RNA polymerase sigma factor [Acidobacteriota bacterium]
MTRARLKVVEGGDDNRNKEPADDRRLVEAARRGDEDAFAVLVERYASGMHRVVARVLSDDAEAWDVVQMAWLRAWQSLDRYDSRWRFSTWVYRIASNLAIDVLRARSSRERAHVRAGESWSRPASIASRPAALAAEGEVERVLRELVAGLTPQQRAAFVLREVEGLETTEVADILGCSATTVRNHIFQARRTLRATMKQSYPEFLAGTRRD